MSGSRGFPGRGYAYPFGFYDNLYASQSRSYQGSPSRSYVQYAQQRRYPQLGMFGAQQSPFDFTGGSQSCLRDWYGPNSLQGAHSPSDFSSSCRNGLGRSIECGYPDRANFLGGSSMGAQRSPYLTSSFPQTPFGYPTRHGAYSPRFGSPRNAFRSGFFIGEDPDNEDDIWSTTPYRSPLSRRRAMGPPRYARYGSRRRSNWFDDYHDRDSYYDDSDDDDGMDGYYPPGWRRY